MNEDARDPSDSGSASSSDVSIVPNGPSDRESQGHSVTYAASHYFGHVPNDNFVFKYRMINQANDIISLLDPIPDASHTRNRRLSPPDSQCLPGTRDNVLKKIKSWANRTLFLNHPHLMWVHGYAACGKSAIAQAIAEFFSRQGRLAASFFFFPGSGDRSRIQRLVATIAAQIATVLPATATAIQTAIATNPRLLTSDASTSAQLQRLIFDPVSRTASLFSGPFIIVLDGINECEDHDEVCTLIDTMIYYFNTNPRTPLRFLLTGQADNHLYHCLHASKQVEPLNLVEHTSDGDISAVLDVAIEEHKIGRGLTVDPSWPCPEEKVKLIKQIGGSYIHLTRVVKRLFAPYSTDDLTPMERLPIILSSRPDFDCLYMTILQSCQHCPHFQIVVGVVALAQQPLSIVEIAEIAGVRSVFVVNILVNLRTIIEIPDDDKTPIKLWHYSLQEFLCSSDRAGSFYPSQNVRRHLAHRCLNLLIQPDSPDSPMLDYARLHAKSHWDMLLHGGGELTQESGALLAYLQETLPSKAFQLILSTYFLLDREFCKVADGSYTAVFVTVLSKLCEEDVEPHCTSAIAQCLDSIMIQRPGFPGIREELVAYSRQSHPDIFHPNQQLSIAMRCIRQLICYHPSTATAAIDLCHNASPITFLYAFTSLPKHLALAIRHDPGNPAFCPIRPSGNRLAPVAQSGDVGEPILGALPAKFLPHVAMFNLELAGKAISTISTVASTKYPTKIWDWSPQGDGFQCNALDQSITFYDALEGIRGLMSCYRSTCEHSSPRCPFITGLWRHGIATSR